MTAWVNRAIYQLPRNGTTDHTVDPTSSTGLVSGAAFTPTEGRLLVIVINGAVISSTPAGWTLPLLGSQVNNTGLYVWYRMAASGSNAFTTTHNGANYPVVAAVYEFASGSTFVKSANGQASATDPQPLIESLTGANLVMSVKGLNLPQLQIATYNWFGGGSPVEDWELSVTFNPTDGYSTSLAYIESYAGSSWQSTAQGSLSGSYEALTFAIKVALPSTIPETAALGSKPVTLALGSKPVTGITHL